MHIDLLPPVSEHLEKYHLLAKKSLGQNFLFDLNLTSKIARQAGNLKDAEVLEIGPGPGALTRALLAQGAKVTAIERDQRFEPILTEIQGVYPDRLRVIFADALQIDGTELFNGVSHKPLIIANLPYNIGTQLLLNWLTADDWPPFYRSLTLMFQKEVAERIVAKPGAKDYGRLAILTGWRCSAKLLFDVPKQAFTPPPKITSSVVSITPLDCPMLCDRVKLELVTQTAFTQRRKMLRQSLKALGGEALLERCGIEATRRPETLTVAEFINIANAL